MPVVTSYTFSTPFTIEPCKFPLAPARCLTMKSRHSPKTTRVPHVYQLPVETLARIFEIGTHDTDDPNDAVEFPMLVSEVSRHFRSVAIQTPDLWTAIRFYSPCPSWFHRKSGNSDEDENSEEEDEHPDDEYEYSYSRDLLWINRSKACPLDLILSFQDGKWSFNENRHYFRREHMETILSLISPHASRIQRFTVVCDTFAPLQAVLRFLVDYGSVMNCLHTLELYRCNEFAAELPGFFPVELIDPIPLLGGHRPAKLTHVVLNGVHVDWNLSRPALSNLRTLELAFHCPDVRPSALQFTQILAASPILTALDVTASGPRVLSTDGQDLSCVPYLGGGISRVSLPHLKTVKIGYQHGTDAMALLHLISASESVVNVTIADTSRPSETDVDAGNLVLEALSTSSSRKFPLSESVTLHAVKASTRAFVSYLDAHPKLHTLTLFNVSKEILSVLCSPSTSAHGKLPCPALRDLSLQSMPDAKIGSIARVRATAGMPLEALSIHISDRVSEEEIEAAERYSNLVTFFGHYEEGSDQEMDWNENDDPDAEGGAFNDPEFDAMFA